jgi:DNA ligase-1
MKVTSIDLQIVSDHRSRAGKPADHYAGSFEDDLRSLRLSLGYDFAIDGECLGRDYIDTMNAKKSSNADAKSRLVFRAFFLMPLTDWVNQSCPITMEENRNNLEKILAECDCKKIILTDSITIRDYAHMMEHLDVVTAPGFDGMPNGQEGLILKKLKATYSWSRELDWCKVKKFFDADARIVGWEYGRNRLSNVMGCVQCVGFLENGDRFEVSVGSGWTDEQRKDVAENFATKWKDATITLRYQEVSKSKSKQFCSLRFPTFERGPRDDKFIEI